MDELGERGVSPTPVDNLPRIASTTTALAPLTTLCGSHPPILKDKEGWTDRRRRFPEVVADPEAPEDDLEEADGAVQP